MCAGRTPTYEAILDDLRQRIAAEPDDPIVRTLVEDPDDPVRSALALRYVAAVQRVALRLGDSPLHSLYETLGGTRDPGEAAETFHPFALAHLDEVRDGLPATVQTNETGRAAVLTAGIARAVERTGVSAVRLLDVGASAGLNLWLDRFRVANGIDGANGAWGPADSPLVLQDFWDAPPPQPLAAYTIAERSGCDLNPLDLADPATAPLLRSFVWPEDTGRAARLRAALTVAEPVAIARADALSWLRDQLAEVRPGVLTVVMHSVTLIYFSDEDAAEFASVVEEAGSRAAADAPLARVSFEVSLPEPTMMDLTVTSWPGGEAEVCSRANPHGRFARWMADADA